MQCAGRGSCWTVHKQASCNGAGQTACLGKEQVSVRGGYCRGEQLAVPAQLGKLGTVHLLSVLQEEHGILGAQLLHKREVREAQQTLSDSLQARHPLQPAHTQFHAYAVSHKDVQVQAA